MRVAAQKVSFGDHFSALLIRIRGSQWSGRIAWVILTRKAPVRILSMSTRFNRILIYIFIWIGLRGWSHTYHPFDIDSGNPLLLGEVADLETDTTGTTSRLLKS